MIRQVLTGCKCIDSQLDEGGILPGTITLIYGEPETGKTTLTLQSAVNCAMQGLKVLFIDTDNTFSPKRLSQLSFGKFDQVAERVLLMRPASFHEQTVVTDHLGDYVAKNFGLVIIDTFTSLYRAQIAESPAKTFKINRELNRQMAILAETAKTLEIPVIVTSQVKSIFNETSLTVAPVATRVLKFWADTVIALKPTETSTIIRAVIEKNRNAQEVTCYLRIGQTGLEEYPFHE